MNDQEINKPTKFFLQPNKSALLSYGLQYRDVLTYGTLLSFSNKDLECYPSLKTLSERSKLSVGFLCQSVKRLESAGWILIDKRKHGKKSYNFYKCKPFDDFKMVPISIFESDLKAEDIATLLCIRQFYYDETLTSDINIIEMSELLGVSYSVLYQRYNVLKRKKYISVGVKNNVSLSKLENKEFQWKIDIENRIKKTEEIANANEKDIEIIKDIIYKALVEGKKVSEETLIKRLKGSK